MGNLPIVASSGTQSSAVQLPGGAKTEGAEEFSKLLNQEQNPTQDQTNIAKKVNANVSKGEKNSLIANAEEKAKLLKSENLKKKIALTAKEQIENNQNPSEDQKAMMAAAMAASAKPAVVTEKVQELSKTPTVVVGNQLKSKQQPVKVGQEISATPALQPNLNLKQIDHAEAKRSEIDPEIQSILDTISKNRQMNSEVQGVQLNAPKSIDELNSQMQSIQVRNDQPVAMILQPVIVPMMAMPIEVMDTNIDSELPRFDEKLNKLFDGISPTSHDFMLGRLAANDKSTKNVDLLTNNQMKSESRENALSKQSKNEFSDQIGLMLPQIAGISGQSVSSNQLTQANTVPVTVSTKDAAVVGMSAESKINLNNMNGLSSHIYGLANSGGGSVKVKVAPEHLGELTVSVSQNRGKLNVKLESASSEARAMLSNAVPELKQQLSQSNFKVDNIEVSGGSSMMAMIKDGNSVGSMVSSSSSSFQQSGSDSSDRQQNSNGQRAWDQQNARHDELMNRRDQQNSRGRYRGQYEENWLQA